MSNRLNIDLTGKTVLVKKELFKEGTDLRFLCEAGFGCHPMTNGTKVFGKWVSDNQNDCVGGYDIDRLLTE
jgi:hypothetical protein